MSINRSIDLIIYIIFHFSFVMNFFNSKNISVSITLNEKLLLLFSYVGIYSNIVSFQPLNRIRLSPMGAYSGERAYCKLSALTWGLFRAGGLIKGRGLNRGFTVFSLSRHPTFHPQTLRQIFK